MIVEYLRPLAPGRLLLSKPTYYCRSTVANGGGGSSSSGWWWARCNGCCGVESVVALGQSLAPAALHSPIDCSAAPPPFPPAGCCCACPIFIWSTWATWRCCCRFVEWTCRVESRRQTRDGTDANRKLGSPASLQVKRDARS